MKENDNYCGFLCSDIMERQEAILKDIDDFAEYNPGFAAIMRFRITQLCLDSRTKQIENVVNNTIKQ